MIVVNKKRIQLIIGCIMISILAISLKSGFLNENLQAVNSNIKNQKTVILDAGHGTPDEGASSKTGVTEATINLSITLKTKEFLEQNVYKVILTRKNNNGIYDSNCTTIREKKNSDLRNRVKIANQSDADIFVSIHLNKIPEEKYWGWQTFYKNKNEEGKKLAESIQNNLNKVIQKENKRVPLKIDNIYIIRNIKIPTTIVECGFLSNNEEAKLLETAEYQEKLAEGIYKGIEDYFN